MKSFHSYTDTRVNIMTSHIQTPIRIDTSGPTWVTAEEAVNSPLLPIFGCEEGMGV
jgi:hypothetical protein